MWAGLIVISTVATGIHYVADVLGGLAVAAVSYATAGAYLKWQSNRAAKVTCHNDLPEVAETAVVPDNELRDSPQIAGAR